MVVNRHLRWVRALLICAVSLLITACALLPDGRSSRNVSAAEGTIVCEGATATRIQSRQGAGQTCRYSF